MIANSADLLPTLTNNPGIRLRFLLGAGVASLLSSIRDTSSNREAKRPVIHTVGARIPGAQTRGTARNARAQARVESRHMEGEDAHALAADQGKWLLTDVAHRVDGKGRPNKSAPTLKKGTKRVKQAGEVPQSKTAALF